MTNKTHLENPRERTLDVKDTHLRLALFIFTCQLYLGELEFKKWKSCLLLTSSQHDSLPHCFLIAAFFFFTGNVIQTHYDYIHTQITSSRANILYKRNLNIQVLLINFCRYMLNIRSDTFCHLFWRVPLAHQHTAFMVKLCLATRIFLLIMLSSSAYISRSFDRNLYSS